MTNNTLSTNNNHAQVYQTIVELEQLILETLCQHELDFLAGKLVEQELLLIELDADMSCNYKL